MSKTPQHHYLGDIDLPEEIDVHPEAKDAACYLMHDDLRLLVQAVEQITYQTGELMSAELREYGLDRKGVGSNAYEQARISHIAARRILKATQA